MPPPTPRPRERPYQLTAAGLAALRRSALSHQPWTNSTGPRTPLGKAISSRNGTTHGLYATGNPDAAAYAAHVKRCKRAAAAAARATTNDPGPVVVG